MAVDDMTKLFKHELGDLLFAEKTFLKGLKAMAKETSDPTIKQRILQHADETEGHIETLGRAFEAAGFKAKATKCDAALGLKEEHDSFKEEEEPTPEILEAFNLGSGLRVEHYEIAGYRSAIALANALAFEESASLLAQNLAQEEAMAKFLESQAAAALEKLQTVEQESEMEAAVEPEVASRSKGRGKSSSRSTSEARA
ncbi:MAG TPA: ferritin-like domain-containing protein [Gemmatimonadaceae bacterium]|nr:ferritin-like domain-containing protein [Gemmatimonadaceae bacterium]